MKNLRFAVLAFFLFVTVTFGQWYDFIGQLQFDPNATTPAHSEGMMFYDGDHFLPAIYNDDAAVKVVLGHDLVIRARNNNGGSMQTGEVVYATGSTGNTVDVDEAAATFIETSHTLGVWVSGTVSPGNFGYVLTEGHLHGINTSAYTEGDKLYLSDTPGELTDVQPSFPSKIIEIGIVTNSHATQGSVHVHIQSVARSEYVSRNLISNNVGDAQNVSDATQFSSGNNAAFANGGTLAGTLVMSTVAADQLEGTRVFKYTQAAGSLNDWLSSGAITVPEIVNTAGISLYYSFRYKYDGADGDIEVRANCVDDSSVLLGVSDDSVILYADVYKATGTISVPKDCNEIEYGVQVVTLNSTKILLFDEIKLDSDGPPQVDLTYTNSIMLEGNDSRAITGSTEDVQFTGSGTGWTSTGDTHFYNPQKSSSVIQIAGGIGVTTSASREVHLYKNGTYYKRIESQNTGSTSQYVFSYTSTEGEFLVADQLSIRFGATSQTLSNTTTAHYLNIVETADAEHVVHASEKREEWIDTTTSWDAITTAPTKGTTTVDKLRWRRVGDSMEFSLNYRQITAGADGSGTYLLDMPAGYSIDTTKFTAATTGTLDTNSELVGYAHISNGVGNSTTIASVYIYSSTQFYFVFNGALNDPGSVNVQTMEPFGSPTYSFINNPLNIKGTFRVPILGWSGTSQHYVVVPSDGNINSIVLEGSDARVITGATEDIQFSGSGTGWTSVGDDNHYKTQFSGSVVQISGDVKCSTNAARSVYLYVNDIVHRRLISQSTEVTSAFKFEYTSLEGEFSKDDELSIRFGATGATLSNNLTEHYLVIVEKKEVGVVSGKFAKVRVAYIKDIKTLGTAGGSALANAVQTRDLNTVSGDTDIVTLSSNQFTLQPGKYIIEGSSPARRTQNTQSFVYDVTNSAYIIDGASVYLQNADNVNLSSNFNGMIDITSATTYEIRMYTNLGSATNGLGSFASIGTNPLSGEVYTQVKIMQILAR